MRKNFSRTLMMVLAVTLALSFVLPVAAEPGVQNGDSLKIVNPAGGAYVIINSIEDNCLEFSYGWNNADKFDTPPVGYWIGVYDVTLEHYVWSEEIEFTEPAPKNMKLKSLENLEYPVTELIPGNDYVINFFVRESYAPTENIVLVQVYFTAP